MELRTIAVQDADGVITVGWTLQGYKNLGTSFELRMIGAFDSSTSAGVIATFLATNSGGNITFNSTDHSPFSV